MKRFWPVPLAALRRHPGGYQVSGRRCQRTWANQAPYHWAPEPETNREKSINNNYLKQPWQGVGFNNIIQHLKRNSSSRNSLGSVWGTAAKSLLQLQPCWACQQQRGHPGLRGHQEGHSELSFLCPVNLINLLFTLLLVITQNVNWHNLCILFTERDKSLQLRA